MMWWRAAVLSCSLFVTLSQANHEHCMFLGYPGVEYDGKDRVDVVTEKSFNKTVFDEGDYEVVFFSDVEEDDPEIDEYECFLQLSAQIMERRGYTFYTVNTTKEQRLRKQEGVHKGEDTIHVYKDGYRIEYHGIRDPDTFVSWLMDIPDDPLTIINDKHDLKDFERLDDTHTRVLGYFEPGSTGLKEFEEAAEDFMGEVEFFAVVDSYWARKLWLREIGEVHLYRPFEDEPLIAPSDLDTEEEFEDWVEKNKDPVLQKLSDENYFDVWVDPEEDEYLIVAFVDEETAEGHAMFKLLKKLALKYADHAGELEIALIDPDEFPIMVDTWEQMFGVEIEQEPVIGLVDISEAEGIWFDMSQLNLQRKEYTENNIEVLSAWIDQILDGSISLKEDPEPPKRRQPGKRRKHEL